MNRWSYDLDRQLYLTDESEAQCIPSTPIVSRRCCRVWPIVVGYPVRRCGLCGEVPE